jgi:HEAT repeat protein
MRTLYLLGLSACLLSLPSGGPAAPADEAAADESVLKEAKVPVDAPGLLEFFRRRTVDGGDEARLKALVRQLGDDAFEAREEASRQLVAAGARARPHLRPVLNDPDVEIARRARDCLRQIEEGTAAVVVRAAVRVLARKQPAGAAAALLNYLPSVEDGLVAGQVRQALADLAAREGKPEPVLVAALKDKQAVKRAAAGAALARLPELLPAVRRLLHDPDAEVRLRAGLALAGAREKEAVPVLIALLDQVPAPGTGPVEELLSRLAGDGAPAAPAEANPGRDPGGAARRKYREDWEAWWKTHGARVDAAKLEEITRTLGCTLVVLLDAGRVAELDATNRPRWQVDGLKFPLDAQLLPGERVLVAEYEGARVTERNRKGEVLWETKVSGPLAAQRLADGHTFIATPRQVIEVDKDGKEVFTYSRPGGETIMKAVKLPNGDMGLITQLGVTRYVRLDRTGKELKSFGVDVRTSGGRLEVLPNGHVLIPEMGNHRVVEHDADGKVVWEAPFEEPVAAVRLPNGNTLVTSRTLPRAVELNRAGKPVWEYKADTRVTRAFRRR